MATEDRMASWAQWRGSGTPWTVGLEEEVMLVSPETSLPVSRCEDVLAALPTASAECARAETHGSALELATRPHRTVAAAVTELAELRRTLTATLDELGLRAAAAGTHPMARWEHVEVSPGARYQFVHDSMRELARREPTFALHVHVAVPGPEAAVCALNRIRAHLPVLLALSANSPFWQGRDSGLASARTPAFQAFPRTGPPRRFRDYADYVDAIDLLIRSGAIPEPTFVWWDARLQPRLGTIEIRVMDTQTWTDDTAALAALVQCLVRLGAEGEPEPAGSPEAPEVLEENLFLAARDGMRAVLVQPGGVRRPVRDLVAELVDACTPAARALDCLHELERVADVAGWPGAARQRAMAESAGGLRELVQALCDDFAREAAGRALRPPVTTGGESPSSAGPPGSARSGG